MTTGVPPHGRGRAAPGFASRLRRPALAASVAFVLALGAAAGVAALVVQQWQHAAQLRFVGRTQQLDIMLQRELAASVAVLRGAREFLALAPTPAPDATRWAAYVAGLDLGAIRSPLAGLGVARQGAPVMLYAPPGSPTAPRALPDDAVTRAALDNADQDTASAALATLVAAPGEGRAPLTLYLPLSPGSGAGFVFAPLSAERLFEPLLLAEPGIALAVRAGSPAFDLYTSGARDDEAADGTTVFSRRATIPFGGTALTVTYSTNGSPMRTGAAAAAAVILLAGAVAAFAFAALVLRLARHAAGPPAPSLDARLNEARMMGIIRSSMEAIITVDAKQTVVVFNPAAEFVFGVTAMEAVGSPLGRFLPERFRAAHAGHVEQFGVTGVTERQMGRQQRVLYGLRANGEEFPIEASISQFSDVTGKLYTVMLRDITERMRSENSLKQSREELRELSANLQNVREVEKIRIARELHDDLGQQLTALKIDLSALEHAIGELVAQSAAPPATGVAARVTAMRKLIDTTVASVRRIAADLRPVMLDDLGLVPAIEWLASDFTQRYGITVERHIDTAGTAFTSAAATALFRIVQEALTNVARHADATRVVLTLEVDDERCALRVVDDGRGSPADASATDTGGAAAARSAPHGRDKSFGLLGIRERAHMLGGTVMIDTAPGEGFALVVTFPLKSLQPEETSS